MKLPKDVEPLGDSGLLTLECRNTLITTCSHCAEEGYLELLDHVYQKGRIQHNRTGIDTRSIFGGSLTFNLKGGFPLLTTKRMFFKGVVRELLFFLSGSTDTKKLEAQNVNIWKGNTFESFLPLGVCPIKREIWVHIMVSSGDTVELNTLIVRQIILAKE